MNNQRGFTLTELMITVVIAAILATISTAAYTGYSDRARNAKAVADIGEIHIKVQKFLLNGSGALPADLNAIGMAGVLDPWGNQYQFLIVEGGINAGAARKDKNLVPTNQYYDVYSMGKDGVTASPFTSANSLDDIVMAGDGAYFGLAEDH